MQIFGQAEVTNFYMPTFVDEDIIWFYIPVDVVHIMYLFHGLDKLGHIKSNFIFG